MTNPFRQTNDNPYDRPLINGQLDTRGAQQDPSAVLYDPASDSVNPAGVALIQTIMKQVDKRTLSADDIAEAMANLIAPMLDRIDTLEHQLGVKRDNIAKSVQREIDQFMGDDAPLDEATLERMADQHRKTMEGVRNGNA
ncbi:MULTISPECIES: hypothetical protein [unclassified Ruegeria]|uniref:hypothetical protein n=1 Tax=unclassified Ruegeria TaxID=2625375 RepID=UPI001490DA9C|nr:MULTISPECIES: hypothetical protein [unclassified Ruegeria]NOD87416.1 hypothetical protein [Ruegeria sp. HKCCD4318]NOE12971.1 hypothetical protein [Ruegeria sp. HKCCD4318-2]NOG08862.1 hypothetical protein [Ruegeria sp. HKCCD4315]